MFYLLKGDYNDKWGPAFQPGTASVILPSTPIKPQVDDQGFVGPRNRRWICTRLSLQGFISTTVLACNFRACWSRTLRSNGLGTAIDEILHHSKLRISY